jgi:prevent-host-death family protein
MKASPRRSAKTSLVGIRELRQNLSIYLRRVAAGETLEVADRGRRVALLSPFPKPASRLDRLIAEGRATDAAGDLLELGLPGGKVSRKLSAALADVRKERL